jgi:hypothetical protein
MRLDFTFSTCWPAVLLFHCKLQMAVITNSICGLITQWPSDVFCIVLWFWMTRIKVITLVLCTFAKLREATISFVMSVRLSVRVEQHGFHRTDFLEILYFSIFGKSVEKVQVSLKSYKNNGYFTDRYTFMVVSRWILHRMRNISDKSFRENLDTNFMFKNLFSLKSYRLWDNVKKIWCSRTGHRLQYGACALHSG